MTIPKIHILLIEDNETDAILVQNDLQQAMGDQISLIRTELKWSPATVQPESRIKLCYR